VWITTLKIRLQLINDKTLLNEEISMDIDN
jgi:hypothetical protein